MYECIYVFMDYTKRNDFIRVLIIRSKKYTEYYKRVSTLCTDVQYLVN